MKHFLVFQLFSTWLEGNLRYRVLSHTDHTRILRIIVDETQKERRLNWTFVDKFFVGMFLEERSSDEWEDERSMDVIQQNLVLDNIGIGTCSVSGYISSYLAAKYHFLNHITMLSVDINCRFDSKAIEEMWNKEIQNLIIEILFNEDKIH